MTDKEVEQIIKERDSKEEAYNKCYFDYRYWKDKAKEYKHRAEVAERALLRLCEETMRDKLIIMYPIVGRQVRDKQELYDYCIEQAEKEIDEERK